MIIQEVYIGRIPEIEEIFNEFKELRSTYKVWKSGNTAKRTAKIEKMIEDLWGFGAFSLAIDPFPEPNAYTYPVSTSLDIDPTDFIISGPKGYKFMKDAKLAAVSRITKGLFCNKAFTDEECFAIFLHELGHSFVHRSPFMSAQQDVYRSMMITRIIMQIVIGIITIDPLRVGDAIATATTSTNFYKRVVTKLDKTIKKTPILRNIRDISTGAAGTIAHVIGNTAYLIISGTGINYLISKYQKMIYDKYQKKQIELTGHNNAYARSSERLSDDFAAMYGFGPQLSTALIKMEDPSNQSKFMDITHSIPGLGKLLKKTDAIASELNGALGAHPSSADRILSILDGMESDLKKDKDMPEKVKKELRANIAQVKKTVHEIKTETGNIKNKNEYIEALTILGLNNGNTEDFVEKRYTDRDQLKKFYDSRKERKSKALKEEAEIDLLRIELEDFLI